ncbi:MULTISPECIES: chemotaxis protein CheW [Ruminococcus]|uniref:CheW protein n=1 Tax=Ruminococcus albus (strain ATCC 27210 / DSM 20455 / JCM 14654 / NCDO 2250 / 7) TaxID=697329 RepID=E6UBP9_RUMA7|nr:MULTISPECIES: chemotaxis protein CheW [Ruminococcus]ADU20641.1 CheW protein [Ruminococcus albus 7 = DSM 20455]MCR5020475.1 chemotaxis protein CheW [Ruminococcus sp.]
MEESQNKYLIFTVDGRTFAMGFSDVRLIVPAQNACKVPDLPDYVDGTIVNEGKTVTVIDLRKRFGYPDRVTTDRECIIICDTKKSLGLLCDNITGFVETENDDIQPPPDVNNEVNPRFISGTFLHEGQPCFIITPELIIRPDDEEKFAALPE